MTKFELEYRKFKLDPHIHQLSTIFQFTIEEVLETLEVADLDMKTTHYSTMIEPIFNRNFGNEFHKHNGTKHHQNLHKNTGNQNQ